MSISTIPSDASGQLRWLLDREAVRALVAELPKAIDTRNQVAYAALFTDDAVLELPFGRMEGRAAIATMKGPPPHWSTSHVLGEIAIEVSGDSATTYAPVLATHAFDHEDRTSKAHSGGHYALTLRRTPQGWLFSHVRLVIVWEDKRPMLPGVSPQSGPPATTLEGAAHAH